MGEFLVSACGHHIQARQFEESSQESFHVYLLGQALSFALVNCGLEPLHATTVVVNGEAVAFLGESGFGKSTLAACFLQAGYRMLTDDLLILKEDLLILKKDAGTFIAYPGPLRIKLYPHLAHRFLGPASNGVAMNSESRKLILPLGGARVSSAAAPLKALYTLAAPRQMSRKQPPHCSPSTAARFHGAGEKHFQLPRRAPGPPGTPIQANDEVGQRSAGKGIVLSTRAGRPSQASGRDSGRPKL